MGGGGRAVAGRCVDGVGSTQLASRLPPTEVVARLNRFFSVAVDVVGHHQGLVNKLIGDAVLAVWGAPMRTDDAAGCALATARHLAARLRSEEHTSELQSLMRRSYAVFCVKKKNNYKTQKNNIYTYSRLHNNTH